MSDAERVRRRRETRRWGRSSCILGKGPGARARPTREDAIRIFWVNTRAHGGQEPKKQRAVVKEDQSDRDAQQWCRQRVKCPQFCSGHIFYDDRGFDKLLGHFPVKNRAEHRLH